MADLNSYSMASGIGQQHDNKKQRGRSPMATLSLLLAGLFLLLSPVRGAEVPAGKEFQIKSVFLYNFAQFVEWPTTAFESPTSPMVIGVLGLDPFGEFLDQTVMGESVNGHPLVVERYPTVADVRPCHILFVSGPQAGQADALGSLLRGSPVLTVADANNGPPGTMVRFVMERNRVRLRIKLEAAREAGLNISSKLLRSAEIVTR